MDRHDLGRLAEEPELVGDRQRLGVDLLEAAEPQEAGDLVLVRDPPRVAPREKDPFGQPPAASCRPVRRPVQRFPHRGGPDPVDPDRPRRRPRLDLELDTLALDIVVGGERLEPEQGRRTQDVAGDVLRQEDQRLLPAESERLADPEEDRQVVVEEMRPVVGRAEAEVDDHPAVDPARRAADARPDPPRQALRLRRPRDARAAAEPQRAPRHGPRRQLDDLAIRREAVDEIGARGHQRGWPDLVRRYRDLGRSAGGHRGDCSTVLVKARPVAWRSRMCQQDWRRTINTLRKAPKLQRRSG